AALDAQASFVGRAASALHVEDLVVLDVIGELTPDAAVRADGIDGPVNHRLRDVACWHERPGRAGLHALAARHTGGVAHGVVEVEHELRVPAPEGIPDDVVHLLFAAGADAPLALDAGVEMHRDRRMREILGWLRTFAEARLADAELLRPVLELRVQRVLRLGG